MNEQNLKNFELFKKQLTPDKFFLIMGNHNCEHCPTKGSCEATGEDCLDTFENWAFAQPTEA